MSVHRVHELTKPLERREGFVRVAQAVGQDELQADSLGAEYLHRTGYDPKTMIKVIDVLRSRRPSP